MSLLQMLWWEMRLRFPWAYWPDGVGAESFMRGHRIYHYESDNEWHYADNGDLADYERPCVRCGRMPTPEGYDACLGYIPSVMSACCGHGVESPYHKDEMGS